MVKPVRRPAHDVHGTRLTTSIMGGGNGIAAGNHVGDAPNGHALAQRLGGTRVGAPQRPVEN